MAMTSLVFSRRTSMDHVWTDLVRSSLNLRPFPEQMQRRFSTGRLAGHCRRIAIFLQFIVQGLQADAQNFRGAGLVVVTGREGFQDQQLLGLSHGGPYFERSEER